MVVGHSPTDSFQNSTSKNEFKIKILLASLVVASISLKLVLWKKFAPLRINDLYFYEGIARAFLNHDWGHFWHFHYYPLYPIFIALTHKLTGLEPINCAFLLNIIFSSASTVPIYLIGREIFGKTVGVIASIFWAFSWLNSGVMTEAEPVYLFFALWGFYLLSKSGLSFKQYLWAISIAGVSYLIKSEVMLFAVIFSLIYFLRSQEQTLKKIGFVLAGGIIFLIFSSPIWLSYYHYTGKFNINPKSRTLFFIHHPPNAYRENLYGLRKDEQGRMFTLAQKIYTEGDRNAIKDSLIKFALSHQKLIFKDYIENLKTIFGKAFIWLLIRIFPGATLCFAFY